MLGWSKSYTEWSWLRHKGISDCADECIFTTDRSLVAEASAVLFCCGAVDWTDIPRYRQSWQHYVIDITESALNTNVDWSTLKDPRARNFFNWTNSYRRDSNIFTPYGK